MADMRICSQAKWRVLTVNTAQKDDITVDEFLNGPEWISAAQSISVCPKVALTPRMLQRKERSDEVTSDLAQHQVWYQ